MTDGTQRRLAAIVAVDVVGFSRLMGSDEVGTLRRLNALHKDLVHPCIVKHDGRIVKLMGDGLLAEFASATQSVRCAATYNSLCWIMKQNYLTNNPSSYEWE
jgi:adenylate cyclase